MDICHDNVSLEIWNVIKTKQKHVLGVHFNSAFITAFHSLFAYETHKHFQNKLIYENVIYEHGRKWKQRREHSTM